MGWEYSLKFDYPQWLSQNKEQIVDVIRALPSYVERKSEEEIWLKDRKSTHSWEYEVRLFLEEESIFIEVSAWSDAFYRDVKNLFEQLSSQTNVRLIDDDNERVVLS